MLFIKFSSIDFNCTHCNASYSDSDDKFLKRCNKAKKGWITIKCTHCAQKFGFSYNIMGNAASFPLVK